MNRSFSILKADIILKVQIILLVVLLIQIEPLFGFQPDKADSLMPGLHSPENVLRFADYLFCQQDYLRAIDEYQNYLAHNSNDTVRFKIALSYRFIGKPRSAENYFVCLSENSVFSDEAKLELFKTRFFNNDFQGLRKLFNSFGAVSEKYSDGIKRLYYLSYLFDNDSLPGKTDYLSSFPESDRFKMKEFYERKNSPPYKSPLKAALLSALIPGAGKIYTKQYGDGVTAFIVTGLLGYLAYDNFNSGHTFRAVVFSSLGALFYGGNIYGSAASAQIYNAQVNFSMTGDLKLYLDKKNYYVPEYGSFCK